MSRAYGEENGRIGRKGDDVGWTRRMYAKPKNPRGQVDRLDVCESWCEG